MQVFASVPIAKGSPIYISYTQPFQTTFTRRNILLRGKQFLCLCSRCKDPTELGSYCSAVCCPSCSGFLLPVPPSPSSTSPDPAHDQDQLATDWSCTKCGMTQSAAEAAAREASLFKVQAGMNKENVVELKAMLDKFQDQVHPHHALLTETRQHLAAALGRADGYSYDRLSMDQLNLKKEVSLSLLTVCNILEPGLSKARGITLLDLSETISRISNMRFAREEVDTLEHLEDMYESERRLEEANTILKMEDEDSLEGNVAKLAKNQLGMIRGYIHTMQAKVKTILAKEGDKV